MVLFWAFTMDNWGAIKKRTCSSYVTDQCLRNLLVVSFDPEASSIPYFMLKKTFKCLVLSVILFGRMRGEMVVGWGFYVITINWSIVLPLSMVFSVGWNWWAHHLLILHGMDRSLAHTSDQRNKSDLKTATVKSPEVEIH